MEGFVNCSSAVSIVEEYFPGEAKEVLLSAARSGIIKTHAQRLSFNGSTNEGSIPLAFWEFPLETSDWRIGVFSVVEWVSPQYSRTWRADGVQFSAADLQALLPDVATNTSKEGRPRKEWWDDLWVEMCRRIYDDRFVPKSVADIERAMNDWVEKHNYKATESTLRLRATKLFQMFEGVHSEKSQRKRAK